MNFRFDDLHPSDNDKVDLEKDDVERSHFVQELLLSMLATDYTNYPASKFQDEDRAVPTICPGLTPTLTDSAEPTSSRIESVPIITAHSDLSGGKEKKRPHSKGTSKPIQRETSNLLIEPSNQRRLPVGTEIAHIMQPPAGIPARNLYSSENRSFDPGEDDDKTSDDNDDRTPPSHRQQSIGVRLQNHIYNPVQLAGVSNTTPLAHYGREDAPTSENIGKYMH